MTRTVANGSENTRMDQHSGTNQAELDRRLFVAEAAISEANGEPDASVASRPTSLYKFSDEALEAMADAESAWVAEHRSADDWCA